ncbi:MAG: glycosyltransferase [Phascolarctobacterium sp.]|uniref:glycosyltransferase family 2 protein n=1 Tax=Phascolarctobacterium sp. TaxID=2049039 RepID=UPI0026DBD70B|nr:glycosyltransferase [Phascolarctobacterium sp.]MDO4921922.1 glycosyltransferase [Phascolarctobacterium sp.]
MSFIIPCYKEPLEQFTMAVDSVIKQTYKNLEIILILDNPQNEELAAKAKEYVTLDERVRFYQNGKNLGLVGTLNKAIRLASGELIARLDSDDYAKPERIATQVQFFPEYDIVSSNFAFMNADNEIVRHRKFPIEDGEIKEHLINIEDCMYHVTWLLKKSVYYQLGFYRDIGPFEDYDFLLRAAKRNFKMYNIPDELTLYRISVGGISSTNNVRQHLGSEYLRANYADIEGITKEDIANYLVSPIGKEHAQAYKTFYKYKEKIMQSRGRCQYYFRLLCYGTYLAFINYYGRKKILAFARMMKF